MAYEKKDSFDFDFTAQSDYPSWTPLQTKQKLNARSEELRLAFNTLIDALNSTGEDNWLYQQIADAILGQIVDGSLTDIKLSNEAGQIKERVSSHQEENASQTKLGHIYSSDIETVWQKIDEITLDVDTAKLDISVPSEFKEIRVICSNLLGSAISNLKLVFNNSSDSYRKLETYNTSIFNTSLTYLEINVPSGLVRVISDIIRGFADINVIKDGNRCTYVDYKCGLDYTNSTGSLAFGIASWDNNDTELNIISLKATSGNLTIGSTFEIWGR